MIQQFPEKPGGQSQKAVEPSPKVEIAPTGRRMIRSTISTRFQLQQRIHQTLNEDLGLKQAPDKQGALIRQGSLDESKRTNSYEGVGLVHSQSLMSDRRPSFSKGEPEGLPDSKKNSFHLGDEKKQSKKPKRRKVLKKDPEDFLPNFLSLLADYHCKHTIREGWKFQAEIPEQTGLPKKSYKLVNVSRASDQFDQEVFKEFKQKLGQQRTEEELCMIKRQLHCDWKEIPRFLEANKQVYKKVYKQKDRVASKSVKLLH